MINVIDAICGAGKTSYAIQLINSNPERSFVYITPYLKEVSRIKQSCPMANFREPTQLGEGKFGHFHRLLTKGENIVSTHALFRMATQETKDLIESYNYTLILDEVMDILEELPLKKDDLPTIIDKRYAHIDSNGFLVWDDPEYDGRYNDIKIMCMNRSLFVVNNCVLMWTFPVEVFNSFKEVYILTYMFDCQIQRYYYDLHDVDYKYWKVDNNGKHYNITPHDFAPEDTSEIHVNIYRGKLNDIGSDTTALSKSWYERNKSTKVKILKNHVYNYFYNVTKSKSKFNLWTTFKDYQSKLSGKGYSKGFLSSNARATNEYMDRTTVAYAINKYVSPMVVHFFNTHGITIDQDRYALSEMIQFIFRSALRSGQEINLYVPSLRMRQLLEQWLLLSK
jgi:hypothetical protein